MDSPEPKVETQAINLTPTQSKIIKRLIRVWKGQHLDPTPAKIDGSIETLQFWLSNEPKHQGLTDPEGLGMYILGFVRSSIRTIPIVWLPQQQQIGLITQGFYRVEDDHQLSIDSQSALKEGEEFFHHPDSWITTQPQVLSASGFWFVEPDPSQQDLVGILCQMHGSIFRLHCPEDFMIIQPKPLIETVIHIGSFINIIIATSIE